MFANYVRIKMFSFARSNAAVPCNILVVSSCNSGLQRQTHLVVCVKAAKKYGFSLYLVCIVFACFFVFVLYFALCFLIRTSGEAGETNGKTGE